MFFHCFSTGSVSTELKKHEADTCCEDNTDDMLENEFNHVVQYSWEVGCRCDVRFACSSSVPGSTDMTQNISDTCSTSQSFVTLNNN